MKISRFAFLLPVLMLLPLLLSACAPGPTAAISPDDKAEIYAAVVKSLYGVEKGVIPDSFKTLYIAQTTSEGYGVTPPPTPAVLSTEDQQKIAEKLRDLQAQIIWVKDYQAIPWDKDKGMVKDGGAGVTLGKIAFQTDGKIQVAGGIYYGNLGAHGGVYIVEKIDGVWTVTGNTGPQWIS